MHTYFGMESYLTIQEGGRERDKQGGEDDGREGNGRREQIEVNGLGQRQGQKRE